MKRLFSLPRYLSQIKFKSNLDVVYSVLFKEHDISNAVKLIATAFSKNSPFSQMISQESMEEYFGKHAEIAKRKKLLSFLARDGNTFELVNVVMAHDFVQKKGKPFKALMENDKNLCILDSFNEEIKSRFKEQNRPKKGDCLYIVGAEECRKLENGSLDDTMTITTDYAKMLGFKCAVIQAPNEKVKENLISKNFKVAVACDYLNLVDEGLFKDKEFFKENPKAYLMIKEF